MEYGHWGITVSSRHNKSDYAPFAYKSFYYPVSTRGPINSAKTEKEAIEYCRSLGGEVKGPFFYKEGEVINTERYDTSLVRIVFREQHAVNQSDPPYYEIIATLTRFGDLCVIVHRISDYLGLWQGDNILDARHWIAKQIAKK
jgi:hypothetical protein